MGRPPLALGTVGAIRYYKTTTGYRARVLIRDHDGQVRALERRAPTKAAAERALKLALRDRAPAQPRGEIAADSRVSALAEAWYAGLADLSPVTMQAYRDRLDRQLLPRLGQLRIRELSCLKIRASIGAAPSSLVSASVGHLMPRDAEPDTLLRLIGQYSADGFRDLRVIDEGPQVCSAR